MGVEMNLLEILSNPALLLETKGKVVGPGRWVTIKGKHIFQRSDRSFKINGTKGGTPEVDKSAKTQHRRPRQDPKKKKQQEPDPKVFKDKLKKAKDKLKE